jgi:hypothetical protein
MSEEGGEGEGEKKREGERERAREGESDRDANAPRTRRGNVLRQKAASRKGIKGSLPMNGAYASAAE